jgi:hypothetical protein
MQRSTCRSGADHSPRQPDGAAPFLIYVALTVAAAVVVVMVTGAEHLTHTARRQIEQP